MHEHDPIDKAPDKPEGSTPRERLQCLVEMLPPGSSIRTPATGGKVYYLRRDDLASVLDDIDALEDRCDDLQSSIWELGERAEW